MSDQRAIKEQKTIRLKIAEGKCLILCRFYHEPLCTSVKTNVNTFAILNQTTVKLGIQALRSHLRLTYGCKLHTLPNTKVGTAKDHGENYIKVRPSLVSHLLRNCLFR